MGTSDTIRAYIARGRVAEMMRQGWAVVAVGEEDRVLMEGPDPDGGLQMLGDVVSPLLTRAIDRADFFRRLAA